MIAFSILLVSIVTISAIVTLLALGILVGKARREIASLRDRRRRERHEPRLLAVVNRRDGDAAGAGGAQFKAALGPGLTSGDLRVIETILADYAVRVEGVARERISQAYNELGFVDRYMRGLGARRWWRRADSAERLGLSRSPRATTLLVEAMQDPVPEVRLRAAKALGEIGGTAAVEPLLVALAQPNRWSTLRVADILSRMGAEAAVGIRDAFDRMPRPARLACLDILAKLRRLESLDFLREMLRSADPDERARSAHALGTTAHPAPTNDLVEALRDHEWPVRAMAAKALGRIGSPETVHALASALTDKQWWVRSNAANALKIMGPRGQKALLSVLQIADTFARHQAVLMLEETGVVEEFVGALASKQEGQREEAEGFVRTLVKLGRIDFLCDLARDYPNPRVRSRLDELLQEGAA